MKSNNPSEHWHSKMIEPRLPFYRRPVRPADVSDSLCTVMLSREVTLEDVDYSRIVPNRFIVEVNEEIYRRFYQPIEARVLKQWSERLLTCLMTTNSRQGRRAYRLGGPIQIEIRPAPGLSASQVRVSVRIQPEGAAASGPASGPGGLTACLEAYPAGSRFPLRTGVTTLGRDESNDVVLGSPAIQEMRLVSGQHAYLRGDEAHFWVFDGSVSGRPSVNGTFVNNRRVPPEGLPLYDGDLLILAAIDPTRPDPDTPGVVAFRFFRNCP